MFLCLQFETLFTRKDHCRVHVLQVHEVIKPFKYETSISAFPKKGISPDKLMQCMKRKKKHTLANRGPSTPSGFLPSYHSVFAEPFLYHQHTGWSSNILDMAMLQDSNSMAVLCPVYSEIVTFQNLSLNKLLLLCFSVEFRNCQIRENMKIQYALISLSLYLVGN